MSETYDFERHEEVTFEDSTNCLVDIEAQQKKVKKINRLKKGKCDEKEYIICMMHVVKKAWSDTLIPQNEKYF